MRAYVYVYCTLHFDHDIPTSIVSQKKSLAPFTIGPQRNLIETDSARCKPQCSDENSINQSSSFYTPFTVQKELDFV